MKPVSPKAFIFDLNGTMIDDMHFHLEVWHSILNDDLNAGLTHYGTTPAPIYFGTGYVTQRDWWTVGFAAAAVNILIWSTAGPIWWKLLGWW